jgi:O-antigen/teichoic acid export membrane protein
MIRDSLVYVIAKLIPGALGVATTSILTHVLSPQRYGIYGLALLIMTFGSSMLFDWIGLSLMRLYEARREDKRAIPTLIALYLGVVALTLTGGVLAVLVGAVPADSVAICAAGLMMAWGYSLFELVARMEIANFRPLRYLLINIGRAIILLIITASVAAWTHDPVRTAFGTAAALALAAFASGWHRLHVTPRLVDMHLVREALHFGLPYALSMTMAGLGSSGVRALVGIMGGARDLGLYTAAFTLSQNTLVLVAAGVGSATYPLAVRAVERNSPEATHRQLIANGTILLAVMVPAALGLALTAPEVAQVLVGRAFRPTVQMLIPWMAAAAFLGSIRSFYFDYAFQLGKKSMRQVWVTAGNGIISLGGAWLLIPRMGITGAALATTVGMGVSCVHAWLAGRDAYPMPLPLGPGLRVLLCAAAMAVVVLAIPLTGLAGLLLKIAAGGLAYGAAAWITDLMGARNLTLQARRRLSAMLRLEPRPRI